MATRFDISQFTQQLLAPLPEGAEQVDSKAFRRQIRNDMNAAWRPVWLKFCAAKEYRDAATFERVYATEYATLTTDMKAEGESRHEALVEAVDNLMEVPAPTKTDLKLKVSWQKFAGGCSAWDRLIAADKARLEGGAE